MLIIILPQLVTTGYGRINCMNGMFDRFNLLQCLVGNANNTSRPQSQSTKAGQYNKTTITIQHSLNEFYLTSNLLSVQLLSIINKIMFPT
jgi:hypothetical protein